MAAVMIGVGMVVSACDQQPMAAVMIEVGSRSTFQPTLSLHQLTCKKKKHTIK